jgi:hypothetical protein
MSAEKSLYEKYPRLMRSSLSADYPFLPQRLPTLPEDYARALEEQKLLVEQCYLDNLMSRAHNIESDSLREQLRTSRTPTPTRKKEGEISKTLNINQIKDREEDKKLDIELIDRSVVINEELMSAENADRVERGLAITIRRGNRSDSFRILQGKPWEDFVAETREKIALLKEVREYHMAVLAIYQAELKNRKSRERRSHELAEER